MEWKKNEDQLLVKSARDLVVFFVNREEAFCFLYRKVKIIFTHLYDFYPSFPGKKEKDKGLC